jgi:hypothetical protein
MSTTATPTGLASPPRGPVLRPDLPQPDFVPHVETLSGSQSSPVKFKRIPTTLTEIRALPEATGKAVDENFVQNHLSVPPPRAVWWNDHCDTLVTGIRGIKSGS